MSCTHETTAAVALQRPRSGRRPRGARLEHSPMDQITKEASDARRAAVLWLGGMRVRVLRVCIAQAGTEALGKPWKEQHDGAMLHPSPLSPRCTRVARVCMWGSRPVAPWDPTHRSPTGRQAAGREDSRMTQTGGRAGPGIRAGPWASQDVACAGGSRRPCLRSHGREPPPLMVAAESVPGSSPYDTASPPG
jgi:hypothetical protein